MAITEIKTWAIDATNLVKALLSAKTEMEKQNLVNDLLNKINEQEKAISELIDENRKLKSELFDHQEEQTFKQTLLEEFEPVEYCKKLRLYVHKVEGYPICPNCVNKNKISFIQQNRTKLYCSDPLYCNFEAICHSHDDKDHA